MTDLLHAEILRQAAPGLQINVTDDQIEEAIRGRFRPEPQPGQEVDDAQLDAEYQNTYTGFLTQVNLTDDAYRRIVEEQLQQRELFSRMLASLPEQADHVELQAIALSINSDAAPEAVKERLELGEDFAAVSREISGNDGYIGWVPEGAFPDFDPHLFGETVVTESGETQSKPPLLSAGEVSDPIYVEQSIFLIQPVGDVESREIEPAMQFQMAGARVERWKDDQLTQGTQEGWVRINFDSTATLGSPSRSGSPAPGLLHPLSSSREDSAVCSHNSPTMTPAHIFRADPVIADTMTNVATETADLMRQPQLQT